MTDSTDTDDVTLEPEDGEGKTATPEQKLADIRAELAKVRSERDEYLDGWQRAKADFVNAKKRVDDERKADTLFAASGLIATLLPVLDSFDAAMIHAGEGSTFSDGVRNTYAQFERVLESVGVKSYDPKGTAFNPAEHESVELEKVDSPNMDNIVTKVHQKGYILNGKVIRPARVSVGHYEAGQ